MWFIPPCIIAIDTSYCGVWCSVCKRLLEPWNPFNTRRTVLLLSLSITTALTTWQQQYYCWNFFQSPSQCSMDELSIYFRPFTSLFSAIPLSRRVQFTITSFTVDFGFLVCPEFRELISSKGCVPLQLPTLNLWRSYYLLIVS